MSWMSHASMGRGSNMLVGLTADRQGAVPANDVAKSSAFGDFVRSCYGSPASATPRAAAARRRRCTVLGSSDGGATFALIGNGTSVARKRIVLFAEPMALDTLRFQVTKALEWPLSIEEAASFATCAAPKSIPIDSVSYM